MNENENEFDQAADQSADVEADEGAQLQRNAPQNDSIEQAEAEPSPEQKSARQPLENSGSMFKNDRKCKDTHPDITGSAVVGGVDYYVSGWRKTGQKGDYYSLSFKPKDAPAAAKEMI